MDTASDATSKRPIQSVNKAPFLLLSVASSALISTIPASVYAQGLMEGAGLMAMPKVVPNGDAVKAMTRGMNAIPNAMPGQGSAAESGIPAGMKMTMPDGSIAIDPKKAKEATAHALADQAVAKSILAKKAVSPAELREAEKRLRNAIAIRNAIWGYDDAGIPKLLNDLGGTYERLKQFATAKACYQNALVYINKRFGTGSSERLDTFVKLAPLLVKDGNTSEALNLQQQITVMKERKLGASDPSTIQARLDWANSSKALDKPNTADIYKQCLTDIDASAGKIPPERVAKFKSEIVPPYVEVLKKQGHEEEAAEAAKLYVAPVAVAPTTTTTDPTAAATPPTATTSQTANTSPSTSTTTSTPSPTTTSSPTAAATPPATK